MVFGFFKKKKKEEKQQEDILAVVEELIATDEVDVIDELSEQLSHDDNFIEEHAEDSLIEGDDLSPRLEDTSLNNQVVISEFEESAFKEKYNIDLVDVVEENLPESEEDSIISEQKENLEDTAQPKKLSWTQRLKQGLGKTRDAFSKKLLGLFGGGQIDEELYEELESVLLTSDVGVSATLEILANVRNKVSLRGLKDSSELKLALKDALLEVVQELEQPLDTSEHTPFVIMMVGVNGAGQTTSIGKLAKYFQQQGKSVMLAAGDTFRAAAREQLIEWGKRNNVTVITQQSGDSAAVCYDAIQSAIAKKIDIILADTAGRLPTQLNLMEEIKKVKRVITKALPSAPHEIMLVLDANIGQNAINQVKAFDDALGLTGLVLTKLDGTAKGGVVCAIAKERPVPLRFIGVGESVDDLRPFVAEDYIDALIDIAE